VLMGRQIIYAYIHTCIYIYIYNIYHNIIYEPRAS